jgi:hypothetical protein
MGHRRLLERVLRERPKPGLPRPECLVDRARSDDAPASSCAVAVRRSTYTDVRK